MYVGTKDWCSLSPSLGSSNCGRSEVGTRKSKLGCRLYLCPSVGKSLAGLEADCRAVVCGWFDLSSGRAESVGIVDKVWFEGIEETKC